MLDWFWCVRLYTFWDKVGAALLSAVLATVLTLGVGGIFAVVFPKKEKAPLVGVIVGYILLIVLVAVAFLHNCPV